MKSVRKVVNVVGELSGCFLHGTQARQQRHFGTAQVFQRTYIDRQGGQSLGHIVVEFARNPLPLLILCLQQFG